MSILVIGLVGILALFPIGIENSRAAVEHSQAGMLAESVKDAIVQGFRASSGTTIQMTHDGIGNNMSFALPVTTGPAAAVDVPSDSITDVTTKARHVFLAGGKVVPGLYDNNVKEVSTPDADVNLDPYHQYSFRFVVEKNDVGVGSTTVTDLYLIHLYIYRNYNPAYYNKDVSKDGNHTADFSNKSVPVSLVTSFKTLVAGN